MSDVTTSLNRHYVKKTYYLVILNSRDFSSNVCLFKSKKKAFSHSKHLFFEFLFHHFYGDESYHSFKLPDGYSVKEFSFDSVPEFRLCYDSEGKPLCIQPCGTDLIYRISCFYQGVFIFSYQVSSVHLDELSLPEF